MKTIMMAGLALAAFTAPALAQTTTGTMQTPPAGSMQTPPADAMQTPGAVQTVPNGEGHGTNPDGTMTTMAPVAMPGPKMSKSDMARMHKCQAMAPDAMAKSKSCQKMAKMHPDMAAPSPM